MNNCNICLQTKTEQKSPPEFMTRRFFVPKPWEMISCYLIEPLPKPKVGNLYIFVIVDYFSKFAL